MFHLGLHRARLKWRSLMARWKYERICWRNYAVPKLNKRGILMT